MKGGSAVQSQEVTCIVCPVGCRTTVEWEGDRFRVVGNRCARGEKYCIQEVRCPVRVVTSLVAVEGAEWPLCPVKTSKEIPKYKIEAVLEAIRATRIAAPVRIGDLVIEDVAGTGANVVATANR